MSSFDSFVRIGIHISIHPDTKKKKVTGMIKNWQNLTKSPNNLHLFKNFAILTGKVNNIFVVDIDNKDPTFIGKQWFSTHFFDLDNPESFPTLVTKTINGGYHVYFTYNKFMKNRNNLMNKFIDVLVDKKCVYEGEGYIILNPNVPICSIDPLKIKLLTGYQKTTPLVSPSPSTLFRKDIEENAIKIVALNLQCFVDENKIHSDTEHSAIYFNKDNTVRIHCFSCGEKQVIDPIQIHALKSKYNIQEDLNILNELFKKSKIDGSLVGDINVNSKKKTVTDVIHSPGNTTHNCLYQARLDTSQTKLITGIKRTLNSVMTNVTYIDDPHSVENVRKLVILVKEDNSVYTSLLSTLNDIGFQNQYYRDKNTGNIFKKVRDYAYVFHMEPMDFLNLHFKDLPIFKSNVNNMDNLIKYMKQYEDSKFPFLKYNKDYIGFSNGILNKITLEFISNPKDIIVAKYIDQEFVYSTDTPLMDQVLHYQFDKDVTQFIYALLGRMFGIRDNFDVMLYLMGNPGCGKSLVIDILKKCFVNYGSIDRSYEPKYGLGFLYNKDIIICDDLPKNIHDIFPQQTFQSIISQGTVNTAVKNGDAFTIDKWSVPMIWAGNWHVSYLDQGQISRRIITAIFDKNVKNPDLSLRDRILDTELPAFIYKCLKAYNELLETCENKSIWKVCPSYFLETQEELKQERNPLYRFLKEHYEYSENEYILISDIRDTFNSWSGKHTTTLNNATFYQVDDRYEIEAKKICRKCNCIASCDGNKCCPEYSHKERTKKKAVFNIKYIG